MSLGANEAKELAAIIEDMLRQSNDKLINRTFKRGEIVEVDGRKADVLVDGGEVPTEKVLCMKSYAPRVGDVVLLLSIGETGANLLVLGALEVTEESLWIVPEMENGWVPFDSTFNSAGYFRDSSGIVHLKGMLKSGTIGSHSFTLPEGYRPSKRLLIATMSNQTIGRVDILPNGQVNMNLGNNAWMTLDNISFLAEQ